MTLETFLLFLTELRDANNLLIARNAAPIKSLRPNHFTNPLAKADWFHRSATVTKNCFIPVTKN